MTDVNPLNEDGTPKSPEQIEQEKVNLGHTTPAPGSQTDPALLLKSLQEEREKRRILEEELETLKEAPTPPDVFSDEGKALQKLIDESNERINALTQDNLKKDILIEYPILKEKWQEFESYRADPENKGMSLRTAAKAFLSENGLLDPVRKGLEKGSGGPRIPISDKMSVEDIADLRKNNWPKYQDMLAKGLIKI